MMKKKKLNLRKKILKQKRHLTKGIRQSHFVILQNFSIQVQINKKHVCFLYKNGGLLVGIVPLMKEFGSLDLGCLFPFGLHLPRPYGCYLFEMGEVGILEIHPITYMYVYCQKMHWVMMDVLGVWGVTSTVYLHICNFVLFIAITCLIKTLSLYSLDSFL